MQTRILSAVLMAFSTAAFAEGGFTLQFDNRRLHTKPAFERALRLRLFGRQCFARAVVEKSARRDKKFRPGRLR